MTTKHFMSIVKVMYNSSFIRTFISSSVVATRERPKTALPVFINPDKELEQKKKLVSSMNFKSEADSVPFIKLPLNTLLHIYKVTSSDNKNGYCENRLYYISGCLKHPPDIVSKYISKRTFIYSLTFDWLKSSLDVLLEFKVPPERILRDLWVLKYHRDTIHSRLGQVKDSGVDTLYPWMVRCSKEIIDRYIELLHNSKSILGNDKTTLSYLAERLNTTLESVEMMCQKTPSLKSIRATKVKSVVDFLVDEGYTIEEIAQKPRIFSSSLRTVQQRLEMLRSHGFKNINLNVLCKSKRDYQRYCIALGIMEEEKKDAPATKREVNPKVENNDVQPLQ